MKLLIYSSFWILLIFVQSTNPKIIGKWVYEGPLDENNKATCCAECPDLIKIHSNGSYAILNDCYGLDPKNPVVETGKWEVIQPSQKLIFKERRFITNHHLYSSKRTIELSLISLVDKKLQVRYNQGKTEQYSRSK